LRIGPGILSPANGDGRRSLSHPNAGASFWYNPAIRGALFQGAFVLALGFLLFEAIVNVRANMKASGIPMDFGFLDNVAGFDINQSLIPYSATSTYGRAFFVGLLNTCLVATLGIGLATVVGFGVGTARLSKNWIIAKCAAVYVEALRNVPLLLQLLVWYNAILKALPGPRESFALPFGAYLNNRGLFVPEPSLGAAAPWLVASLVLSVVAAIALRLVSPRSKSIETGFVSFRGGLAVSLIAGFPIAALFIASRSIDFTFPELKGFNFSGGARLLPEFVALVLGLSLYTAAFIAEIVRAGIQAVPRGQREAAASLGLSPSQANRFIVGPQAMRVITPLLTSQYLNLVKNSSLAVFIGYPDLVQVFAGTVLNQTGAAVQVIFMTMAVYLTISLLGSLAMNIYNRRFALVER
jgi:general L-amino acid transport system permease protein